MAFVVLGTGFTSRAPCAGVFAYEIEARLEEIRTCFADRTAPQKTENHAGRSIETSSQTTEAAAKIHPREFAPEKPI